MINVINNWIRSPFNASCSKTKLVHSGKLYWYRHLLQFLGITACGIKHCASCLHPWKRLAVRYVQPNTLTCVSIRISLLGNKQQLAFFELLRLKRFARNHRLDKIDENAEVWSMKAIQISTSKEINDQNYTRGKRNCQSSWIFRWK
jgi:hypothetical protein